MKKLAALNSFTAWLVLAVALGLFSGPAQAYVYDAFTSPGINPSIWVDSPTSGLFIQPGDGYLHFGDSGGGADKLSSFNPVNGAFSVSMQYSGFLAGNMQPGNEDKSSAVELALGTAANAVFMVEGKNQYGNFFQGLHHHDGINVHYDYDTTGVTGGWLGLVYNGVLGAGGRVDFWYNAGAGWTWLDYCAPNFSQAPYLTIQGYDTYGTSLSFQVDQVQVNPIPLPASVLLLGSGLLGLWGLGRRFKKN